MLLKCRVTNLLVVILLCFTSLGLFPGRAEVETPASSPHFWSRECLTCDQPILPTYQVSLDIDSQGYPHLVYDVASSITNTYTITTTYKDTLGWHSQIVDDTKYNAESLIFKLDTNDYEHILYDGSRKYIKYAYRDPSGWHVQQIYSGLDFGNPPPAGEIHIDSLVLDSADRPHATVEALFGKNSPRVYYIYLSETGWQKEEVGTGYHGAVALDSSDAPHIAYVTMVWDGDTVVDRILNYTYQDTLGWHTEEVAHQVGPRVSIAMDSTGFPHVVSGDPVEYHFKDENGWHRDTLGDIIASNPILLLNDQGKPFIGSNDCCGHIAYAFWSSEGWERGRVGDPNFDTPMGMAMDGDGGIHFAFRETSTFDVIYLYPYTGPIYTWYFPLMAR